MLGLRIDDHAEPHIPADESEQQGVDGQHAVLKDDACLGLIDMEAGAVEIVEQNIEIEINQL